MKIFHTFLGFGSEPPAFMRNFVPRTAESDAVEEIDVDEAESSNRPARTADAHITLMRLRAQLGSGSMCRRKRKRLERQVRSLEGIPAV